MLPKIRAEEFRLADRAGVASIDPVPWFCTPTLCPVLVRNIMVYYDTQHMTPAWSSFIAPALATTVTSILSHPPRTRTTHTRTTRRAFDEPTQSGWGRGRR